MPGSHQLAVCDTLPRLVRDGLGRLHSLGSSRSSMPRLEAAIPMDRLSRPPPSAEAFRHAHRLLGLANKLRWGVLQQLGEGRLEQARAQLLHALQLIRTVGESSGHRTGECDGSGYDGGRHDGGVDGASGPESGGSHSAGREHQHGGGGHAGTALIGSGGIDGAGGHAVPPSIAPLVVPFDPRPEPSLASGQPGETAAIAHIYPQLQVRCPDLTPQPLSVRSQRPFVRSHPLLVRSLAPSRRTSPRPPLPYVP